MKISEDDLFTVSFRDNISNFYLLSDDRGCVMAWNNQYDCLMSLSKYLDPFCGRLTARIVRTNRKELEQCLPDVKELFYFNYNKKLFFGTALCKWSIQKDRIYEIFVRAPKAQIASDCLRLLL